MCFFSLEACYAGIDAPVAQFEREIEDVVYTVKSLRDKRNSFELAGALARKTYLVHTAEKAAGHLFP